MKFLSRFAISGLLIILLFNEINQSDAELLARKFEKTFDSIVDEYQYKKEQVNFQKKSDVFTSKNYYRKRRSINDTGINICRDKNEVQSILKHLDKGEKLIKYDKDFNYTILADSKNCLNYLIQEIHNRFSLSINEISKNVQIYYDDLVQTMQDKIDSFLNSTSVIDTKSTNPEIFLYNLDTGNYTLFRLIKEIKNIQTAEELSNKIVSTVKSLNGDIIVNVSKIVNQAQYLDFLGNFSSSNFKSFDSLKWISPFQNIIINLKKSKSRIKKNADNIANEVKKKIESNVKDIGKEIINYVNYKEKTLHDIETLFDTISELYNKLSDIEIAAEKVDRTMKCTRIILNNLPKLNITDIKINNSTKYISANTIKYGIYLDFLNDLTRQSDNSRFTCVDELHDTYIGASRKFYYFLLRLYEKMSDYKIQNNTGRCINYLNKKTQSKETTILGDIMSEEFFKKCFLDYNYYDIYDLVLNQYKLNNLNKVLDLTLKSNLLKSCDYAQGNKLVVKGDYVKLSDIQKHDCKTPLKSIEIYALKKVFIDVDLDETGKNLQLIIIAPTWDVQGTRQIILDGNPGKVHNPEKANNGTTVETTGENGKPGLPGDPGGHFLGIGAKFLNADDLSVTAIGGKGGPGQAGGDGAKGPDGISPPRPEEFQDAIKLCKNTDGKSFTCNGPYKTPVDTGFLTAGYDEHNITLYGSNGGLGGNGGNGGKGGNGGDPGKVIFIFLSYNNKKPEGLNFPGSKGDDGDGGNIGMTGTSGSDVILIQRQWYSAECYIPPTPNVTKTKFSAKTRGPIKNWHGTRGLNTAGRKEPKKADKFENLSYFVNNYKSYLRENLSGNVREIELRDFLYKLETNYLNRKMYYPNEDSLDPVEDSVYISDLYDEFGFTHDLYVLESQFLKLQKKISFLPFYESLFDRVNQYKEQFKYDTNIIESQKVADYLLAAILSKIYRIKNNLSTYLVIDIDKYFQSVKGEMEEYKNVRKQVQIDKYNDRYQNEISSQIKEGINLIENDILPEMDKIIEETNNNIRLLVNETVNLQEKGKNEKSNLIDKMNQLQGQFVQEGLLSFLKISSVVLAFAGPVGAVAGANIGITVAGYETFRLDNINTPSQVPTTLPAGVSQSLTRISDLIKNEQKNLEEKINYVQIMLNEISRTDPSDDIDKFRRKIQKNEDELKKLNPEILKDDPSLVMKITQLKNKISKLTKNEIELVEKQILDNDPREIKRKILEIEKNIKDEQAKGSTKDPASVDRLNELEKEKSKLTTKYSESLNKEKPKSNIKAEKYLKVLNHIQTGVSVGNAVQDAYSKMKTHISKVEEFDKNIKQATEKIGKLEKYKTNIYEVIIPMIEIITGRYIDVRESSRDKSHVFLDVMSWRIQSTFKDVQIQIREMTQGFQTQVGLTRCIEKFEYGVLAVIQMYDRLRDAYEKKQLGHYIANIHSGVPITNNEALNREVNNLDLVTRSNLVLYEYGQAMDAFKQYIFPFANLYLNQFDLNVTHNNLSDLVDKASREMNTLIKEKDKRSSLIDSSNEADSYVNVVFKKKPLGAGEFFVWDYNKYHKEIFSLLKGEEIMINADITKSGLDYNAVKFNEIGIQFRLPNNKSFEDIMHQYLKHFTVEMTHLENSYYKCGTKLYVMNHSQQKIKHDAFSKNEKYKNFNEVYSKMVENPPLLSPYTMWKLKLSNKTKSAFENLSEFIYQPIDLALIGKGKYVGTNHEVCNTNLEKYYEVADTSTIN